MIPAKCPNFNIFFINVHLLESFLIFYCVLFVVVSSCLLACVRELMMMAHTLSFVLFKKQFRKLETFKKHKLLDKGDENPKSTFSYFQQYVYSVESSCASCEFDGPSSRSNRTAWFKMCKATTNRGLEKHRYVLRIRIQSQINDDDQQYTGYQGGVFDKLKWTQSSYIQPQMHPYDRYFYSNGSYTVDRYLNDVKTRYGGIDAMLMWPTYTNIGIDDRNQFDYFRTMPGGLDGVKQVIQDLKTKYNVRVLLPYNPWDTGTRREPYNDSTTMAIIQEQIGADGFNGDTMQSIPQDFWGQSDVKRSYPIALEPEGGGDDESLNWSTMGWGYFSYNHVPSVARYKFLSSGKFMTNTCDRWASRRQTIFTRRG